MCSLVSSKSRTVDNQRTDTFTTAGDKKAFDFRGFKPFKLQKVEPIKHNTNLYRFQFDSPDQISGLAISSHVLIRYTTGGLFGYVFRPYSPISTHQM
ncbi:hypothetical protein EC973_004024 [Apophysomyces ossiformis]|uniref:cytochrome-b5 reductase n=1 Tax=Apophysomyces ossiformis TaxID=679940 RepID=A0A8H7BSQ4_9FUNG|nr:hypothetical protein EC973_004024 [Apophysomyces ossiformis]